MCRHLTHLSDKIWIMEGCPGLTENRCLERRPQGAKLYQVGQQEIALGAKFRATVILDIQVGILNVIHTGYHH